MNLNNILYLPWGNLKFSQRETHTQLTIIQFSDCHFLCYFYGSVREDPLIMSEKWLEKFHIEDYIYYFKVTPRRGKTGLYNMFISENIFIYPVAALTLYIEEAS